MDAEKFVQNVKNICIMREVPPTIACRESGAGKNLLSEVARGIVPSVNKVQALAQYLGVTTSELLGEAPSPADILGARDAIRQALPEPAGRASASRSPRLCWRQRNT